MEIHQLEYFLAVEKYHSFSAAALEICISQSTLSQQIKKLEDELGVKLFVRYARTVRLTPAGEDFLIHAVRIVSEIQQSRETAQKYTNFDKGFLKIGVVPNLANLGVGKIITSFMKKHPGLDVEIHTFQEDEILKGLQEKKVNVAFINTPFTCDYELDFFPFASDKIVLLVSKNHRLANESIVDLCDLAEEQFLMMQSSSTFRNTIVLACSKAGFEPKIILDGGQTELVRSFLEEGIGVALIRKSIAKSISNSTTSTVPIRQFIERQCGLAVPKYARLPLSTGLFKDFFLSYKQEVLNYMQAE